MAAGGRSVQAAGELLSFVDRADGDGFAVVDHVERRRCEVRTSDPVDPDDLEAGTFDVPVDRVVAVATKRLTIPHTVAYVRERGGRPIAEIANGDERTFAEGGYWIELTTAIKLYVVVESGFEITATERELTIDLGASTEIALGARTQHDRPAATVTTTGDPEDLMRAVSSFGSALKTTSCERSYPTLRGHPPAIEYGDELSVPDVLDGPETGITIAVPPEYGAVYAVSSLAHYLGATVVPGEEPLVRTENGFVHRLDGTSRDFEAEVARVLKQCLLLDCVTRTEGYYPVELHERNQIEDEVTFDVPGLYGRPLSEQFEAYMEVPYEVVEPHVPRWKLTAHVEPTADSATVLPYVVRDLAAIRATEPTQPVGAGRGTTASLGIDEFVRESAPKRGELRNRIDTRREPAVRIDGTDAFEDMWIGEGVPVGGTKGMVEAFRNHVARTPSDGDIDITVVVNDDGMANEGREVNEVYGSRDALPFEVTVAEHLTTRELRNVLRSETDFLHYIGHIDEDGFECSDGRLDAAELEDTGVDSFFLNACDSYWQGKHLVEAGAIAGVATLTPVPNEEAEEMGKTLARLLNQGFPLYAALDVAHVREEYSNYIAIGHSGFSMVQPDVLASSYVKLEHFPYRYDCIYYTYPTDLVRVGSMERIYIDSVDEYYLSSGKTGPFELTDDEIREFISIGDCPIIKGNDIFWDDDVLNQ